MRVRILIALVVLLAVAVVVVVVRQQRAWSPPSANTASRYTPALNTYLASTYAHAEGVLGPTHRWYCATKLLGIHPDGSDSTAYAWALCEETLHSAGRIKTGSAYDLPVVVHLRRVAGHLQGVSYDQPGDAPAYTSDVQRLFPATIADWILAHPTAELAGLQRDVLAQASQ